MGKIFHLVRVQLGAVLSDTLSIGKNRNKRPKLLLGGVLFFSIVMSLVVFIYSMMIGVGLKMFDSLELLPALVMAATSFVVLMTTIFKVKGTIFGFRDYDMVMSLPVSTGAIAISRLLILYSLNILFVLIMMVPMTIAYAILAAPGIYFYILSIISIFIVPLVPIIIASLIGTLIAFIASKFKRSNLINLIISIAFFAAIISSSFMVKSDGDMLLNIANSITSRINQIYPLAPYYAKGVAQQDILSYLIFAGVSIIAFLLYTVLFHRVFKKLNTLMMNGRARSNYKMGELKTSSPIRALYGKEIKRYFSSTLYVLNTAIGMVMLTIGAIALNFVDLNQVLENGEAAKVFVDYIPVYVVFCVVLSCTTMVSISLEGKSLWILKSMPISPRTIYHAKIGLNLTIIAPSVLDVLLIGFALRVDIVKIFFLLLITVACAILISLFGLLINLLIPNFNWTAEVTVIKQSAATMITIFSGMGYAALFPIIMAILPGTILAYFSYFALSTVLCFVLYKIIMSYGVKRFYTL